MNVRPNRFFVSLMAVALGGFAPSAFAYLDPSTGSMILSAIVGIIATVGLALKTYWYKLKSLFKGQKATPAEATSADVVADTDSDKE